MISPQTICGIFDSNAFESCETGKAACRWLFFTFYPLFFTFFTFYYFFILLASPTFTFCGPLLLSNYVLYALYSDLFQFHIQGTSFTLSSRASITFFPNHFPIVASSTFTFHSLFHFHIGTSFTFVLKGPLSLFHCRGLFLASSLINSSCLPNTRHYSR